MKGESKKQRACDSCRVKKIKCDGPQRSQEGLKCSKCESSNINCTFVKPPIPKSHSSKAYSDALESRIERLEALIQRLSPGYDYTKEVGPPVNSLTFSSNKSNKRKSPNSNETVKNPLSPSQEAANDLSDDSDIDELELKMRCFFLNNSNPDLSRYYGTSSSTLLLSVANNYGSNNIKTEPYDKDSLRDEFWKDNEWIAEEKNYNNNLPILPQDYPENDLLEHLIDAYFSNVNYTMPLLHKPTFINNLKYKKLHSDFAGVVLLVCAIGSQYSDDARILSDKRDPRFVGEDYYKTFKLKCHRKSLLASPSIEEIQSLILHQIYFQNLGSLAKAGWSINGYAISLCEDVGYHRERIFVHYNDKMFNELRKRVFWCTFLLDSSFSVSLGRRTILNKDFDVGLPNVLSEEVGTKNELSIRYFREFIKLYTIQNEVLQYSKKKRNAIERTQDVAYLNSKLVDWNQDLEPKLRFNPACRDNLTHILASYLRIAFHMIQIQIYRKFLTLNRRVNTYRTTSMSICTSAAMSILQIWSILFDRLDRLHYSDKMISSSPFISALIMVISACESRKYASGSQDHLQELKYIEFAFSIFKRTETRDITSGKSYDLLNQLIKSSSLPVQPPQPSDVDPLFKLCENMKTEAMVVDLSDEASQQNQQFYLDILSMIKNESDVVESSQLNDSITSFDNLFPLNYDNNPGDTEWIEFLNNIFVQNDQGGSSILP